jgi:hypothetical protein
MNHGTKKCLGWEANPQRHLVNQGPLHTHAPTSKHEVNCSKVKLCSKVKTVTVLTLIAPSTIGDHLG